MEVAIGQPQSRRQRVPARYRLTIMCGLAAFFAYAQRYGLALAIVRMQTELDWDRITQGQVLAAFFLGYMVAQLPAGYLAVRVGPGRFIFFGLLASSLLNLLIPQAAALSPWAVAGLRVLQGLAQGTLFPGFAAIWSAWAPPMERSRLDGVPRALAFLGGMACNALGGAQCESTLSPWLFGGWQGVFTLWGVAGIGFSALWWALVADTPAAACATPRASRRTGCRAPERDYIRDSLSPTLLAAAAASSDAAAGAGAPRAVPCSMYCTIMRSRPVWAITLAHTLNDCALYMLDDGLPPYLRDVHALDLSHIGAVLGINGALKPLAIVLAALGADRLRRSMRTVHVRKLITAVAFVPQGLFLLALAARLLDDPAVIVPLLLVVAPLNVASNGGGDAAGGKSGDTGHPRYAVNHLDIAPQLASLVLAFYNMGGQVMGWATPWIIGELTPYPDGESRLDLEQRGAAPSDAWLRQLSQEWRTTFLVGGCANLLGAAVFVAFASDREQPWARLDQKERGSSSSSGIGSSSTSSSSSTTTSRCSTATQEMRL